ncbi:NAD-dependent protein deacylase sirtuin-5, mitochondrial-like isoform X1 [Halichondria panicea]|uniref:NAD-dependent protein deacylase sirtuin-5, mitochondrial-like isoform X1 n=1 Tax=Halichondria panicea TaxID=6063 RepID=UPI00312B8FC0
MGRKPRICSIKYRYWTKKCSASTSTSDSTSTNDINCTSSKEDECEPSTSDSTSTNDINCTSSVQGLEQCDLCLLVGTSSVVYPAAGFAPRLAARGVSVAEFNLEPTPVTGSLKYHFQGKCGEILPEAVKRHPSEPEQ